jgi:hypothetical protein
MSLLDEPLTHLGLALPAQEQDGEDDQRDDAALGEHDQPAGTLVAERVAGVERVVRPDEDTGDDGPDGANYQRVNRLCTSAEPSRPR